MDNYLEELLDLIKTKKNNDPTTSYTALLHSKGLNEILKKIGEESTETIIAAKSDDNEDLDTSAGRVLKELTNLDNIFLEQFYAFGDPLRVKNSADAQWLNAIRDVPTARVITIAYYSLVKIGDYQPAPSSFARKAFWCPISEVPALAFDHNKILDQALISLKTKLRIQPIGFELLHTPKCYW